MVSWRARAADDAYKRNRTESSLKAVPRPTGGWGISAENGIMDGLLLLLSLHGWHTDGRKSVGRRCLALQRTGAVAAFPRPAGRSRSQICQIGARGAGYDVVNGVIAPGRRLARFGPSCVTLPHSHGSLPSLPKSRSTSHSAPTPASRT